MYQVYKILESSNEVHTPNSTALHQTLLKRPPTSHNRELQGSKYKRDQGWDQVGVCVKRARMWKR